MKYSFCLAVIMIALISCKSARQSTTTSNIVSIEAKASPCFGTCPVYEMAIGNDRSALYNAIRFNKNQEGRYKATIKEDDFKQLIRLIEATNFTQLQDEYKLPVTDLPGMDLQITYNKNQVKKIHDYGARGTEELKTLYQFLSGLRESQQWEKLP